MEDAKKRLIYFAVIAVFLGIVIFISRGPHISNALKRMILPELENMLGRKVIAQKIYLNLFPLFIEAKGLKVFDEEGGRVLTASRAKGYVGLSGILRKELILKRVVVNEPEVWTDRNQLNDMIEKVDSYLSKEQAKIKVKADAIEVRNGEFSFYDAVYDAAFYGKDVNGEALLGEFPRLKVHIKEMVSNIRDLPEFKSEINSAVYLKKGGIDIKNITVRSYGSEVQTAGLYSYDGKGEMKADLNLIVDSVKKVFGLSQSGEGKIYAKGGIKFGEGSPSLDIKISGNFYLQALMEFLKVKERVEGWVDFDGEITGTASKPAGSADARLKKGNLFSVDVDDLQCKVFYSDNVLSFKNGKALLYNGRADAEVSLKLPDIEQYSVKVDFVNVDSPAALKLIDWQPAIPKGKVKGGLYSSGSEFNPTGWFDFEAPPFNSSIAKGTQVGDALGRIKKIRGDFKVQGDMLSLSKVEARTERSTLDINGTVDMSDLLLNLNSKLETVDISDITSPYFKRFRGSGDFLGTITGKSANPEISGMLRIASAVLDDNELGNIAGKLSYNKKLLEIKELLFRLKEEQHAVGGSIKFADAKDIFDFKNPEYKLTASVRGADVGRLAKIFYKKLPIKGRLDSDFSLTGIGPAPELEGSATIVDVEAYRFTFDFISTGFSFNNGNFILKKLIAKKGKSAIKAEGRISGADRFSFNASAYELFIKDVGFKGMPEDAVLSINAKGSGTFENPVIELKGEFSGGTFKGRPLGKGTIDASLKNRDVFFTSLLFDEKVRIKGKAYLNNTLPWSAEVDILSGRYDFLLSGLLKDIPEDLLLNIKGRAELSGDKEHIAADAVINRMTIALFGHSFSNDSDIRLRADNRKIAFSEFMMRSGNASLSVQGDMEIGKEYNIVLEGSSSLSPLKGFSKRISVLRGDADFTLAVSGKWDSPLISGSLNVTNGSFGLKEIHQRISSINGYFYFENNQITIQRLTGKLGGGDVDMSGLIYLKGFAIKRFYLNAKLNNITTSVTKDFTVNFNGDILYKGTLDAQDVSGDLRIIRARYRERVEWKSWLLKARPREKPKAELTRLEKAALNIKIYGTENIIVDNNIARAPLKVDLVMRGAIGNPLLFGRVESKEGKVYFRNNEFRILSASADFADPNRINPAMEITAQTLVKGYNIRLRLEGQLEHFNLTLISEPPLEETDILSLLTVGQVGRELKGLEGGIGASEAAAFLTGKVQDVFEDRLRNITGLDRVQVDPYVSKSTGTIGPRVTVSKRLLGDRLFVTYVSAIGSTEEQVLKLEYILGKNVSLLGVRDEKGSVGGDIKFRFEFK